MSTVKPLFMGLLLSLSLSPMLRAQAADSLGAVPAWPSARTVVLRSALVPGWGQWSNGQRLKAAVVVAGELGLFAAAAVQNHRAGQAVLETEKTFYIDDRNRFFWYAAALWVVNMLDAYVDARLRPFDTGPDLSGRRSNAGWALACSFSW